MSFGIIVSLPGYNADTCSPEQAVVHSDFPSPKVEENHWAQLADYTFPDNPGVGTTRTLFTIPHGYSYIPAAFVYVVDVSGFYSPAGSYNVLPYSVGNSPSNDQEFVYFCDATNLYIQYVVATNPTGFNIYNNILGATVRFKYYIFTESGA